MEIDIVGGSYKNKYVAVNTERTINWYIHKKLLEGEKDKYQASLQSSLGLSVFGDTTGTQSRRIFVARTLTRERCFVVVNKVLYEQLTDGTYTTRGTLSDIDNDATSVYMEVNGADQVMIAHTSASYIYDMPTDVLTKITDGEFPGSATYLSYTQGYFIICSGGRVWYSDLNNGLSWTGSSVFTPAAQADKTLAAVVWRDDIHCFGTETIETYVNDGTTPFSKQGRDTINIGVVNVNTICVFHDGIIFQGKMRKGQTKIYYYNGQQCVPVSSSNIDWQLNNPSLLLGETWDQLDTYTWDQWFDLWGATQDDSYAELQYSKDGHALYFLTIPPLHTTYVFDMTTQEWTERQSLIPGTTFSSVFRGKYMVNFANYNLWTDIHTGKVLKEDATVVTEDGSAITRTRISNILSTEKKNISIYDFELDMTTGVGLVGTPATAAKVAMSYSRNGGNTYSTSVNLSSGIAGEFTKRPRTHKLGTARDWTFKLVVTDAADLSINKLIIHGIVDNY